MSAPNIEILYYEVSYYKAGNISHYLKFWENLTNNSWIIDIVKYGLKLDFTKYPIHNKLHHNTLTEKELAIIDIEVGKFISKEVLSFSNHMNQENLYQGYLPDQKNMVQKGWYWI